MINLLHSKENSGIIFRRFSYVIACKSSFYCELLIIAQLSHAFIATFGVKRCKVESYLEVNARPITLQQQLQLTDSYLCICIHRWVKLTQTKYKGSHLFQWLIFIANSYLLVMLNLKVVMTTVDITVWLYLQKN